jgi:hypothetical protein
MDMTSVAVLEVIVFGAGLIVRFTQIKSRKAADGGLFVGRLGTELLQRR